MKRILILLSILFLFALSVPVRTFAVAPPAPPVFSETWIYGVVTDASDGNAPVAGATVDVTCNGITRSNTTDADGSYGVQFSSEECQSGDLATAVASFESLSGSGSELVQDTAVNGPLANLDVAVINVSVPEMGTVMGMLAAAGSVGAFMMLRKRFATTV